MPALLRLGGGGFWVCVAGRLEAVGGGKIAGGPTNLNFIKKYRTTCLQFLKSFAFLEVEAGILFFPNLLLPDSK